MDRERLLRAQDDRHVYHLAVNRDRATSGCNRLAVRGDDLLRRSNLVETGRKLFIENRNLGRMNDRRTAEPKLARAPHRLAKCVKVLVVRDRSDETERQN